WHVVGHSFGGQVALELALQRPDLVSELTLLCTRDTPYSAFAAAADHVVAGRADVDGALQRWFSRVELADDGAATPSIRCPAVVVAAEHDQVSDPVTTEAMHCRLARSEFVVLPDAWHMSVFTDLDRLA